MSFSSVKLRFLPHTPSYEIAWSFWPRYDIVKPTSPIAKLMGERHNGGNVHILDLIQRVHYLFDHKMQNKY